MTLPPRPQWYIKVHAETHDEAGKRRRFTRTLRPPYPDGFCGIRSWLSLNLPGLYHGCEVSITTPLHHNRGIVDPDYPHDFHYSN
jgi:hypothetical protein